MHGFEVSEISRGIQFTTGGMPGSKQKLAAALCCCLQCYLRSNLATLDLSRKKVVRNGDVLL